MKRRWLAWVAFLDQKEEGTSLALLRIAVAAVMLMSIASVVVHGLVAFLWIDRTAGGFRNVRAGFWPLAWAGGANAEAVWGSIGISLVASSAMLLGIGGRFTVFVALYAYRNTSSIGLVNGGYDGMIFNAAWLLVLSQCTRTLSLDCWRKHRRWQSDEPVSAWPRYLFIFQLVVVYLATGLQKASASWTFADHYSALYWFLQDPTWLRFDTSWTASAYPLTQFLTAVVWHFEIGAPLLLLGYYLRRDWRLPFAVLGLGMHAGILLLLDMGPFSWISMTYYLALITPEEWHRLETRWSKPARTLYSEP